MHRCSYSRGLIGGIYAWISALKSITVTNKNVIEHSDLTKKGKLIFNDDKEYVVTSCGACNNDMNYSSGQKLKIIQLPDDFVIIEKEGGPCNPYIVTKEMLSEISTYPKGTGNGDGEG